MKKSIFTKYQINRLIGLPPGLYHELLYFDKSVFTFDC
jgi:hypothetical protein